jgi:hypothetical protein
MSAVVGPVVIWALQLLVGGILRRFVVRCIRETRRDGDRRACESNEGCACAAYTVTRVTLVVVSSSYSAY